MKYKVKLICFVHYNYKSFLMITSEYKDLETHNEVDDKPEKPKIKFL
jgi:hypothetical protein